MNTALITGSGGSGCGRAIARLFAARDFAVVVTDIDEGGCAETVRLIREQGGRAATFIADISKEEQVRDLVTFAESTFGGISVLVNNASMPYEWMPAIQIDFLGALYATRCAIEAMRRSGGGSVVNIASISALWHGRKTPGGFPGYDVAKAAVIRMTTAFAHDAANSGIRFNCLAPGWISTDGPRQYWESLSPEERLARGVPSKLLAPEEIAAMVLRLATDTSLNGRIVAWWSEDSPRLIEWGDRGYRDAAPFDLSSPERHPGRSAIQ